MKKGIHPDYHVTYKTRSCYKADKIVLEIDSKSHPFYTGKQVLVDTTGRVDRFQKRFEKSKQMQESRGK
jgi:large subunit ribosomal protein L31